MIIVKDADLLKILDLVKTNGDTIEAIFVEVKQKAVKEVAGSELPDDGNEAVAVEDERLDILHI